MKLLKRFVSWTIWGVILLNVALMTVSYIPQAQNYLGSKVADAIADKLGTQVSIGRVDLGQLLAQRVHDLRGTDLICHCSSLPMKVEASVFLMFASCALTDAS